MVKHTRASILHRFEHYHQENGALPRSTDLSEIPGFPTAPTVQRHLGAKNWQQVIESVARELAIKPVMRSQSPRGRSVARTSSSTQPAAEQRNGRPEPAVQPRLRSSARTDQALEVRRIFEEFAIDFARAETRLEVVQALTHIDQYVDRILAASQTAGVHNSE